MRALTPQELEVARLLARGMTLEEVARNSTLTYSQVKALTRDLRKDLNVDRTRDIPFVLRSLGVIDGEP